MALGAIRFDPQTGLPIRASYVPPTPLTPQGLPATVQGLNVSPFQMYGQVPTQQLALNAGPRYAPTNVIPSSGNPIAMGAPGTGTGVAPTPEAAVGPTSTPFSQLRNASLRDLESTTGINRMGATGQVPFANNGPGNIPFGANPGSTLPPPNLASNPPPPGMTAAEAATGGAGNAGLGQFLSALRSTGGTQLPKAGIANFGLGAVMSGLPGALQARGVDFNRDIGPVRGSGQALRGFLEYGGPATMVGGPLAGTAVGTARGASELQAGNMATQRDLANRASGGNEAVNAGVKAFQLGNALVNPIGAAGGVMDAALDKAKGLPVIGGLFGGGGENDTQQQQQQTPTAPAPIYNRDTLTQLMGRVGLDPQYQQQLLQDYNTNLELAKATNAPITKNQVIKQSEYNKLAPDQQKAETRQPVSDDTYSQIEKAGDQGVTMPDSELEASVWQQTVQMIPQIVQQQRVQGDYLARQAALQAVIAPFVGQYFGQGSDLANTAQSALGNAAQYLPANMQGPASNLTNVTANGYANMGDATAASLAILPGLLALEGAQQQGQSGNSYNNVLQNQFNQKLATYQLQQQYPELFANQGGSSSDPLADLLSGG